MIDGRRPPSSQPTAADVQEGERLNRCMAAVVVVGDVVEGAAGDGGGGGAKRGHAT